MDRAGQDDYGAESGGDTPSNPPASLVAAAIRGEAEALRTVWQANRRWVAAVLLAHKPREADLEDLLQEVAVAYVRMVRKLRDEATFKPWLRTVAINTARAAGRDATRRRRGMTWNRGSEMSRPELSASAGSEKFPREWSGSETAAAELVTRSEEANRLAALAAQLPDGYREPLLLKALRGMSYREIGRVLDLPETTIETRIARARRMLRNLAETDEICKGGSR